MKETTQEILALFRRFGDLSYGEDCTVLAHSVQSGLIARDKGLDTALILAAFLHDLGHLLPLLDGTEQAQMGAFGMQSHETIAANWLTQKGFAERITSPIRYHVDAKRYLCSVEAAYWEHLSLPSRETLHMQGGSMTEAEVMDFEALPLHEECVLIRQIDDEAKAENFTVLPEHLQYFEDLLNTYLIESGAN